MGERQDTNGYFRCLHPRCLRLPQTVFGSITRHNSLLHIPTWQRLAKAQYDGGIKESKDGNSDIWKMNLIKWRVATLVDDSWEFYFQKTCMSLSTDATERFAHLAKHPNGVHWSEVITSF